MISGEIGARTRLLHNEKDYYRHYEAGAIFKCELHSRLDIEAWRALTSV